MESTRRPAAAAAEKKKWACTSVTKCKGLKKSGVMKCEAEKTAYQIGREKIIAERQAALPISPHALLLEGYRLTSSSAFKRKKNIIIKTIAFPSLLFTVLERDAGERPFAARSPFSFLSFSVFAETSLLSFFFLI